MSFADLLENLAIISSVDSLVLPRVTSNSIETSLSKTVIVVAIGNGSCSGKAELKLQSSSVLVPLVPRVMFGAELMLEFALGGGVAKSNMEDEDAFPFCDVTKGEFELSPANGSERGGVGTACCCWSKEGVGVVDCEVGRELENEANAL